MKSLISLIFCFIYLTVSAQITESSLIDNPVLKQQQRQVEKSEHRVALGLPFFDDFSYDGPFPDSEKWEDNYVYVNNSFGHQPPSIGYATFDGLDDHGKRYSENYGTSDTLTSRPIDLTTNPTNLKLSYYLQAKGLGEKPEFNDSIILQFLSQDEKWVTQAVYNGWSGSFDSIPEFSRYENAISSQYIHQNFQFRFINWSGNYGIMDVWHLDYVHLSNNEIVDIAFTQQPNEILKGYRSMPIKHFANDVTKYLYDSINIHITNLAMSLEKANASSLIIRATDPVEVALNNVTLLEVPPIVPINQIDLEPGQYHFRNKIQEFSNYKSNIEAFVQQALEAVEISTDYYFENNKENLPSTIANSACSKITNLSNYFAYDDGSAESAISANVGETGNPTLANAFYAEVEDTLSAVQFMFPRTNTVADNQLFTLRIWTGTLDGDADFEVKNIRPLYIDNAQDTFQAFTTYRLTGDLSGEDTFMIIPQGDFFVGLYQISSGTDGIPIGFDKNTPNASAHIWFHNGQEWSNVGDEREGALMIRPMFGFDVPQTTVNVSNVGRDNSIEVSFYPNPFSNTLNIASYNQWQNGQIDLLSVDGKIVLSRTIKDNSIDTEDLQPGMYVVKLTDKTGKQSGSSTVIKQ
jgi:hypothetical protein